MTEQNISTLKTCKRCENTLRIEEFNRDKNRSDGRFPYCRVCTRTESKKQYAKDLEKSKKQRQLYYQKNKSAHKARAKRWAEENPQTRKDVVKRYSQANPEKRAAAGKKHREENPGLYRAHFKKRQQLKRNAMPSWADEAAIKAVYDECSRISKETGVKHHVDHYYPLQNELVCGLHVQDNLRIITAFENLSKANKIPTEDI